MSDMKNGVAGSHMVFERDPVADRKHNLGFKARADQRAADRKRMADAAKARLKARQKELEEA